MGKPKQTSQKSDREKKKRLKQKEKEEKREQKKKNSSKGKSFEQMIAYVDQYGQLSDTPPDQKLKTEIKLEDIQLGPQTFLRENVSYEKKGRISNYISEKGFGFIKESLTQEKVFFHISGTTYEVKEGDLVIYELVSGPKGLNAVNIKKQD